MNFNIVFVTQYMENYGAHDWDGKGQCPQYWKMKGGDEIRHPTLLTANDCMNKPLVDSLVKQGFETINRNGDYSREWVVDWYFLAENEKTEQELLHVEYEPNYRSPTLKFIAAA